jgi:sulfite reductase (NADPH) flavoprotein alpha-component
MLEVFAPADAQVSATVVHVDFKGPGAADDLEEPVYTADNPAEAEIAALVNLSGTGSTRETWHVELATEAPGFAYQPGAAIGILPENDPKLAAALLDAVGG